MPPYARPADFNSILRDLTRRVAAIENGVRASRTTVRNGLLVIADDEGRTTLAVGKQPDGTVSLRVFDPATGVAQVTAGELAGELAGTYGLEQFDPATGRRVPLSAIALGTVGLAVTSLSTGTGFWVSSGSDLTVTIPSTGNVEVTVSSTVTVPAFATGLVGVSFDGSAPSVEVASVSAGDAQIAASTTVVRRRSMTAGSHTIGLRFMGIGGSCTFNESTLILRPY